MELTTPFEAEPMPSPEACDCPQDGCVKTGYHYADIRVPLELKPHTALGDMSVECCGEPTVDCRERKSDNTCEVTITQKVNIKIPIRYQVTACMGESVMNCDGETPCCQQVKNRAPLESHFNGAFRFRTQQGHIPKLCIYCTGVIRCARMIWHFPLRRLPRQSQRANPRKNLHCSPRF